MPLTFELRHTDARSQARLGHLHTPHGSFDMPAFMPMGLHLNTLHNVTYYLRLMAQIRQAIHDDTLADFTVPKF